MKKIYSLLLVTLVMLCSSTAWAAPLEFYLKIQGDYAKDYGTKAYIHIWNWGGPASKSYASADKDADGFYKFTFDDVTSIGGYLLKNYEGWKGANFHQTGDLSAASCNFENGKKYVASITGNKGPATFKEYSETGEPEPAPEPEPEPVPDTNEYYYLVGNITGSWVEPSAANKKYFVDNGCVLIKKSETLYTGTIKCTAASTMFRIHTALSGWHNDCLGYDAQSGVCSYEKFKYEGVTPKAGNVNWTLNDTQGKTFNIAYDLSTKKVYLWDVAQPLMNIEFTAGNITATSATLTYTLPSKYMQDNATVTYWAGNDEAAAATATDGKIELTGLTASTSYTYNVKADLDYFGYPTSSTASVEFTTADLFDITASIQDLVTATRTQASAKIPYTVVVGNATDATVSYTLNGGEAVTATASPIELKNLAPDTEYTCVLTLSATDNGEVKTKSTTLTFKTPAFVAEDWNLVGVPTAWEKNPINFTTDDNITFTATSNVDWVKDNTFLIRKGSEWNFKYGKVTATIEGPNVLSRATADGYDDAKMGCKVYKNATFTFVLDRERDELTLTIDENVPTLYVRSSMHTDAEGNWIASEENRMTCAHDGEGAYIYTYEMGQPTPENYQFLIANEDYSHKFVVGREFNDALQLIDEKWFPITHTLYDYKGTGSHYNWVKNPIKTPFFKFTYTPNANEQKLQLADKQIITGVESVSVDSNKTVNVYNINGALIMSNTTAEEAISTLAPGLYIVGGKKMIIK